MDICGPCISTYDLWTPAGHPWTMDIHGYSIDIPEISMDIPEIFHGYYFRLINMAFPFWSWADGAFPFCDSISTNGLSSIDISGYLMASNGNCQITFPWPGHPQRFTSTFACPRPGHLLRFTFTFLHLHFILNYRIHNNRTNK